MSDLLKNFTLFAILEISLLLTLKTLFVKLPMYQIAIATVYIILIIFVSTELFS